MGDARVTNASGPLAGVCVLDMTRVLAGPYAGQILGDLGADVIKVERKDEGDDCRRVGPPWIRRPDGCDSPEESTYFQAVNRNKRSVAVDYAKPEGAQLLRELAARADVLIENYRTGTLCRYGLGADDLRRENPRLIYASLTGFGQSGPYAERPSYDCLAQAMAGLMSVTGPADGELGASPMRAGVPVADTIAGLYTTIAVLAALTHRHVTGVGQFIDVSLFDAQVASMMNPFSAWFNAGVALERTGNDHPSVAPYGVFDVDDGHIVIATVNDREFGRLAKVLGHPEWIEDPRFAKLSARNANRVLLKRCVNEALRGRTKAEWVDLLNENVVSCGPINGMADVERDPQVLARGLVVPLEHPVHGTIRTAASPMRFSESPVTYRRAPPRAGEHTAEVLRELLGVDEVRLAGLRSVGAI
jgi:crotonobetainyl-CoA:carnitine CoA-transferase CaiB-like acyl-CoA transferase